MQDRTDSEIPFGAMEPPTHSRTSSGGSGAADAPENGGSSKKDWRKPENRRGGARRGGRRRRKGGAEAGAGSERDDAAVATEDGEAARELGADREGEGHPDGEPREGDGERPRRRRRRRRRSGTGEGSEPDEGAEAAREGGAKEAREGKRRRGRRAGSSSGKRSGAGKGSDAGAPSQATEFTGMFALEKGGFGTLRRGENQYMPSKQDVYVPKHLVQKNKLRDGAFVTGKIGRGQGKHKYQLHSVAQLDGRDPRELAGLVAFKNLTSIDPDFHYAVGDSSDDVSMRILDVICPIGRGTRGLIVAPPRSGKTILMRKFAAAIEETYPDVHLIVLLVDERPEEATEWQRSIKQGEVYVSTNDEMSKHHVQLAEVVWKRACRLVELGEDVIVLLDSITRLARAYNNVGGGSGRTMSGGIDSRTMEKPRAFFGSARNTETAGSLTILGTTLVETGSRMDQVIFEEFKGTGNMELVLSRKLADRRIFPAIDVERSGTRKEEKLLSRQKLRRVTTLRRVLLKMNFIEAMELLVTKLEDVEKTDDFLARFEVDPEA